MDVLTAYTDRMICYEYVLNRMELKYLSKKELSEKLAAFEEEEYMKMLEGYLFGSKDQKVALDKIRLIMGQIPVHMTKNKLFERIGEALTLYQDGDKRHWMAFCIWCVQVRCCMSQSRKKISFRRF